MGSLHSMKKNIKNYELEQFYKQMTPEQYRQGIRSAVQIATDKLAAEYENRLRRIQQEVEEEKRDITRLSTEIISVELLYELASQMECFVDNPENLDEKVDKIQEIYENAMNVIDDYTKCKKSNEAQEKYNKKKAIIKKFLKIEF